MRAGRSIPCLLPALVASVSLFTLTAGASAQAPATGSACDGTQASLRREVEALNARMVVALQQDRATVARFYADDATIVGGGMRASGRAEIDRYWAEGPAFVDWKLEVLDVGGSCDSIWQRGLSTLTSTSGRSMVTEFLSVLKRAPGGTLEYHLDMFVAARPPQR
jgi:ketosteroid isomerase-like protein